MSFLDWVRESRAAVAEQGLRDGAGQSARRFYYGALRNAEQRLAGAGLNVGTNLLDAEWDLLVVIDGCRYDLMAEVAPGRGWLSDPVPFTSVAGGSLSWMHRTFTPDRELGGLGYVTANPFSDRALSAGRFGLLDEVWRYAWDETAGTVPAPAVTEAAVDSMRRTEHDRYAVHYMQPHHPFVPDQLAAGINRENPVDHDRTVWEKLADGELDRERVWSGYRANLEYVLDAVETLCQNADADTVAVTADHGNAVGEWGVYGHGDYPIPVLRRVPWVTTTASDDQTLDPDVDRRGVDEDVTGKLRDLGYR